MQTKRPLIFLLIVYVALSPLHQCTVMKGISSGNKERVIEFSGYKWIVRDTHDRRFGPGPNLFSNSSQNVWVDKQGRLHLKIVKRKGKWYCAEVTLDQKVGYGKYIFHINSPLSKLDKHIVAGLFTYLDDNQEIDIEFSRWSVANNPNAQYVIQPYENPGNTFRFQWDDTTGNTVHSFEWIEEKITFESGLMTNTQVEPHQQWTYQGNNIPQQSDERLKINLWLYKGTPPSKKGSHELVIDSVKFIPFDKELL